MSNQRLELTWYGKDNEIKVEPRILILDKERSCLVSSEQRADSEQLIVNSEQLAVSSEQLIVNSEQLAVKNEQLTFGAEDGENPTLNSSLLTANYENMLIHGDNLLALKSLEQEYAGKVKCIYIDPPYNTGSAFEHYDDNLEHSTWLSLMKPRLEILRSLLSDDGFLCCHIDDSEGHYLKILFDEIFGRKNYLTTLYVRVRYPDKTLKSDMDFHKEVEQIFVYRKEYGAKPNLNEEITGFDKYCYYIEEIGNGKTIELGGKKVEIFDKGKYQIVKREGTDFGLKEIWASGTILDGNSSGRFFRDYLTGRYVEDGYGVLYKIYGIGDDRFDYRYFTGPNKDGATKGKYYQGVPSDKLNSEELKRKLPINGFYDLAGNFGNCRLEGGADFRGGKKPEILIEMILKYFSNPGDLVLDSFLGSGTTAAVAHKMGRRWIGIELGEHCYTHCIPRLKAVVDGEQGGISKAVGWKGGGGFKFYELAPSLLRLDSFGNLVIDKCYNADMLAMAMAKHEEYTYSPDPEIAWKQGRISDNAFIFTTTRFITPEYLTALHNEMKENERLLICASSFNEVCKNQYANIDIKKIPNILLGRCEFGADNYNLNIIDGLEDILNGVDDELRVKS